MAESAYDDADFFAAYAGLPRSVDGLDAAPEWPTIEGMLPPIAGCRVLDLGCGYGWFCRWAAEHGAAAVVGLDHSWRMLGRARAATTDRRITYREADLDALESTPESFDLVFSSLALHYVVRLDTTLAAVADALAPGGALVCSVEHPIYTAPVERDFVTLHDGRRVWPVDRYLDEGPRATEWLGSRIVKQHRTVDTYLRLLRAAQLELVDLVEWAPTADEVAARPDWAGERDRPAFLLLSARRRR